MSVCPSVGGRGQRCRRCWQAFRADLASSLGRAKKERAAQGEARGNIGGQGLGPARQANGGETPVARRQKSPGAEPGRKNRR